MADPRETARGTADRIGTARATSPSSLPPVLVGSSPATASNKYVSHVIGKRRATSPAPAREPISDFERGLAQREPHYVVIPTVPITGKAATGSLPGWNPAAASRDMINAVGNAKAVVPHALSVTAAAQRRGVDMPASLVAGWMSQESSGRPYFVDPGKLDEVGLIQISREERIDYLGSTEPGGANDVRAQMLDRREGRGAQAQAEYAARLMAIYQAALTEVGMPADALAMAKMIRFAHNRGLPNATRLVRDIARVEGADRLDLGTATYSDIVKWAATHGRGPAFLAAMRKSDYAALGGQSALRKMGSSAY